MVARKLGLFIQLDDGDEFTYEMRYDDVVQNADEEDARNYTKFQLPDSLDTKTLPYLQDMPVQMPNQMPMMAQSTARRCNNNPVPPLTDMILNPTLMSKLRVIQSTHIPSRRNGTRSEV